MPAVVVVGAQLGDEGKGKVTDLYAEKADMVVRFNGGANAGHTLVANGKKIITHLIPSGVMHPHITCVLGNGMVIDPLEAVSEIKRLQESGFLKDASKLKISRDAHVVMPYHKDLDAAREGASAVIGTTKKGIGPAYESKASRKGIRMGDLLDMEVLAEMIKANCPDQKSMESTHNLLFDLYCAGSELARYLVDTSELVNDALDSKKNVIIEGAQAALLDIDHGNYPFVSSSSSTAGGACASLGIGPKRIDCVLGVAKVYTTAVGRMPFPTEMPADRANIWREAGGEYGSTTGRPRRIGWLDIPALKRAIRINGMDQIAWVKIDVLQKLMNDAPVVCYDYEGSHPMFQRIPKFSRAEELVEFLTDLVGINSCLYSTGPGREETVVNYHPFE
jgi:adenylosuccinate synthase